MASTITKNTPPWMVKLVRNKQKEEARFKRAYGQFAEAWNMFLADIESINDKFGTSFCVEQAISDFGGVEADETETDEEDED